MSNLLKYRCYKETFFLDYLPDEVFINLQKKDRIEYRKLRENYQIIESKSLQILNLNEEIIKKQLLVKTLKNQITPSNSKDSYLDTMNLAKENLEDIINNFQFSISIGLRTHKTKSKIQSNPKFYLRVTAYNKKFKNIYIGGDNKVKALLKEIHHSSFDEFNKIQLRSELLLLYTVYTRNFIWNNSWEVFFESKHSIENLKKWARDLGNDIYRW